MKPIKISNSWYLLAGGVLGAAIALFLGPILAIFAVFTLGAIACWRTNRILVGLGATALGLVAASLTLPFGSSVTTPMDLAGAALAALFIAAPLVFAARQKACCGGLEPQERRMAEPPRTPLREKAMIDFVLSRNRLNEHRNNAADWN